MGNSYFKVARMRAKIYYTECSNLRPNFFIVAKLFITYLRYTDFNKLSSISRKSQARKNQTPRLIKVYITFNCSLITFIYKSGQTLKIFIGPIC
jgi:hypothetical protein